MKIGIAFLGVAALLLLASGTPEAFHSGGVAECSGCHSMHAPKPGGDFLLVGTDQSSACLTCHQNSADTGPSSYHISTADVSGSLLPLQRTPGGDFSWVKKSYSWTGGSENGATHGHNVIAADFGYTIDPTNPIAPGGTFPSSQLGCQSCHDPHSSARRLAGDVYRTGITLGQAAEPIIGSGSYATSPVPGAGQAVGVYRLLRGLGDSSQGVTFAGVAIAMAPSTYNQTEATNQVRVAYGHSGANTWGNWCATCHPDNHSVGHYVHPIDEGLDSDIAANYNAYVKSGDLTGVAATSFTSLVPFVENTGSTATLASHASSTDAYLNGPATSDKVACLSCHRAHATGMMYGLRFDVEYEFMVKAGDYVGTDNPDFINWGSRRFAQARGRKVADWKAAYYDRPATKFATYQRVLCNKCHAKD